MEKKKVNLEKSQYATEIQPNFLSNLSLQVKYFPNLILSTTFMSK